MMNLSEIILSWNLFCLFLKKLPVIIQKKLGYQSDHLDHNGHEDTVGKYFSQKLFGQFNIHMNKMSFLFLQLFLIAQL